MVVLPSRLRAGNGRAGERAAWARRGQLRARPAVPVRRRAPRAMATPAGGPVIARGAAAARRPRRRLRRGRLMDRPGRCPALFARASAVLPGGVNSPVRAFGAVGGVPVFMASGHGPYLTDVDGREYVDLVCSWGPMILGHAYPSVISAVAAALADGTSFGTVTPGEVDLASEIVARAPVAPVRLVNARTAPTMSAVELAPWLHGR